jgi:sulfate adenylyltransferase subunit 1 (EFTu-like GTPase family)
MGLVDIVETVDNGDSTFAGTLLWSSEGACDDLHMLSAKILSGSVRLAQVPSFLVR